MHMGPFRKVGEMLHRFFMPSETNGYRPDALQKAAASGMLVLILLTFTLVNIQSLALITSQWLSGAILPSVLIDLTNENRTDGALGALRHNALLDEAARLKAEDMAKNEYFAHDSPGGITPWYWFERVGYEYTYAGENLAVHFTDSDDVVQAWMRSPGHRANIMSGNYTEIGIGTARGEYKGAPTIFVVQLFGRPLSREEKTRVAAVEMEDARKAAAPVVSPDPATVETISAEEEETLGTPAQGEELGVDADTLGDAVVVQEATSSPKNERTAYEASSTAPVAFVAPRHEMLLLEEVATESPFIARGIITIPVGENGGNTAQVRESHFLSQLSVRPHMVMSFIYGMLALLIVGVLGISIALEWRRHHPVQVAYGVGLIAAMWVAFYVHTVVLSGVLIA